MLVHLEATNFSSMLDFRGFGLANSPKITLNSPSAFVQWKLPMSRSVCLASATSGVNTQQLREQLDRLHKEAESTAAKANSARLRLIRLSEAADSLRRQAVLRVQTGKENDARELLYQKKKIMQAMEKSKNRIELLDELSTKLRQVISAKETQLIGNVSLDFEVNRNETTTNIRIVPPKDEYTKTSATNIRIVPPKDESTDTSAKDNDSLSYTLPFHLDEKPQPDLQSLEDGNIHGGINSNDGLLKENNTARVDGKFSLKINNSYQDFLKNIDRQLNDVEDELSTFLSYAALIFGNENKLKDSKVQLVTEILENVCHLRERIATIIQTEVETRL